MKPSQSFLFLFTLLCLSSLVFPTLQFTLKSVDTDLTHGCQYYTVNNPDFGTTWVSAEPTSEIIAKNMKASDIKDGTWELSVSLDKTRQVWQPKIVCSTKDLPCDPKNFTSLDNKTLCDDKTNTYQGEVCEDKGSYKTESYKEDSWIPMKSFEDFPPGKTEKRYCASWKPQPTGKGWGIEADMIPSFGGVRYDGSSPDAPDYALWNASWSYKSPCYVNTTVSSSLTNFPVHCILNTSALISAGKMNTSCQDLRAVNSSEDGQLFYEIENGTCNTTSTVVWIKLNTTTANGNDTIWIYYGNPSATDGQNPTGVWTATNGTLHMASYQDSKNLANNITVAGTAPILGTSGCRYGQCYNITAGRFSWPSNPMDNTKNWTLSFWVNFNRIRTDATSNAEQTMFSSTEGNGLLLLTHCNGYTAANNTCYNYMMYSSKQLTVGSPTMVTITHSTIGNNSTIYINGTYDTSITETTSASGAVLMIGDRLIANGRYVNGTMDEIRASIVTQSADWIKAEYAQTDSIGAEEVSKPAPSIINLSIAPATAYRGIPLNCSAYIQDNDSALLNITAILYRNGILNTTYAWINNASNATYSNLSSWNTVGANISCAFNATDGLATTDSTITNNITILNQVPWIANLALTPASNIQPYQNLNCSFTAYDNDSAYDTNLTAYVYWYRNNTIQNALNASISGLTNGTNSYAILNKVNFTNESNEYWNCSAKIGDGYDNSSLSYSANSTIKKDNLTACNAITNPGSYRLINDITHAAGGDCFAITASNVALDCQGYNLTASAPASSAFYLNSVSNITLKNCNIFGQFTDGIYLSQSNDSLITNNTAYNLSGGGTINGIILNTHSNNNTISYNTITYIRGIVIYDHGADNLLANNLINQTDLGISISFGANNNTAQNNLILSSTGSGVHLFQGTNNTILNNTVSGAVYSGFALEGATGNNLTANTAYNAGTGFSSYSSSYDNTLTDCFTYNSTSYYYSAASNTTLHGMAFGFNSSMGIVNWTTVTIPDTATYDLVEGTNIKAQSNFISLNDTASTAFNATAAIKITTDPACLNSTLYKLAGFPTTYADIIANGTNQSNTVTCSGGIANFTVSSFSGYALGPVPPNITGIAPASGITQLNKTIEFNYNTTTTDNMTCDLNLDGVKIDSQSINDSPHYSYLNYSTTYGFHSWNVNCSTIAGATIASPTNNFTIIFGLSLTSPSDGSVLSGNSVALQYTTTNLYPIICNTTVDGSVSDSRTVSVASTESVTPMPGDGTHTWNTDCYGADNLSYAISTASRNFTLNTVNYTSFINLTTTPTNILTSPQSLFYDAGGNLLVLYYTNDTTPTINIKVISNGMQITESYSKAMNLTKSFFLIIREPTNNTLLAFDNTTLTEYFLEMINNNTVLINSTTTYKVISNSYYNPYSYANTKHIKTIDYTNSPYYLFVLNNRTGSFIARLNISSTTIQTASTVGHQLNFTWQTIANSSDLSSWFYAAPEVYIAGYDYISIYSYNGSVSTKLARPTSAAYSKAQIEGSKVFFERSGNNTFVLLTNLASTYPSVANHTIIYNIENNLTLDMNVLVSDPSEILFVDQNTFVFFDTNTTGTFAYSCYMTTSINCTILNSANYGATIPFSRGNMVTRYTDANDNDIVTKGKIISGATAQLAYQTDTYDVKYTCNNELSWSSRLAFTFQAYSNTSSVVLSSPLWGYIMPSILLGNGSKGSFFTCTNGVQRQLLSGLNNNYALNFYSLANGSGLHYTFTVKDAYGQLVPGVLVTAYRFNTNTNSQVAIDQGLSDFTGSVTLYLQPYVPYILVVTSNNYATINSIFVPTTNTNPIIQLGSSGAQYIVLPNWNYEANDVSWTVTPTNSTIYNATNVTFQISVANADLQYFGIVLYKQNITTMVPVCSSNATAPAGGILYCSISSFGTYIAQPFWKVQNYSQRQPVGISFVYSNGTMYQNAFNVFKASQPIGPWGFYAIGLIIAMIAGGYVSRYSIDGAGLIVCAVLWFFTLFNPDACLAAISGGVCISPLIATIFTTITTVATLFLVRYL